MGYRPLTPEEQNELNSLQAIPHAATRNDLIKKFWSNIPQVTAPTTRTSSPTKASSTPVSAPKPAPASAPAPAPAAKTTAPVDTSPAPAPVKAEQAAPGVWSGGQIVIVDRKDAEDLYFAEYKWGDYSFRFQFDSVEQVEATLGKGWATNKGTTPIHKPESYMVDPKAVDAGSVGQVSSPGGSWQGFVTEAVRASLTSAGITDPTMVGRMLKDPDVQSVIVQGTLGSWSAEQTTSAMRQTKFYKETLYPGIEKFYGFTDPERRYEDYTSRVSQGLEALGVNKDSDGSYRTAVGTMLNKGVGEMAFLTAVPAFIKATSSSDYFSVLDQWMQREGHPGLSFDNWFDAIAGQAPPEVAEVIEKATLQFSAEQQGVGVSRDQISRISGLSDLNEEDARAAFADAAEILRAVGGDLGQYGVTQDEILSLVTGIKSDSGRSLQEIAGLAEQIGKERGRADDRKLSFFTDYSRSGTPQKIGLAALSPESG